MNVTVERLPESQVRLAIVADAAEHNQAVEKAFRKLSREITLPGFRRGKAPRHILERMLGREVFVEEANKGLMDTLYRQALEQEELVPVGEPEVEFGEAEPLAFTVTVPVYPTVDPGPYLDVRVEPVDAALDESKVDELVERLRLTQSPWVDPAEPRPPTEGDQVTIDIEIKDGDEEFQPKTEDAIFVLGEDSLLADLRTAVETLQIGESTTLDVSFPSEGDDAPDDRRRGKTLGYTLTLKELKTRDLLPLDDDFAKTYANADSLQTLRDRIRTNLHAERTTEARSEAVATIIDAIAEGATIEVPAAMIDEAVTENVQRLRQRLAYSGVPLEAYLRRAGQTEEEYKIQIRPDVAKRVRNSVVLREIAKREGIEIADIEIESEIDTLTADAPEGDERDAARTAYRTNEYLRSAVRNDLFDRRLTDRIVEIATEGRGAIVNGWEPSEPAAGQAEETEKTEEADDSSKLEARSSESVALPDDELALATMEIGKWVKGDGTRSCPEGYPIKGNADSMLYHLPGTPAYRATIPEMCFANEDEAAAHGFSAVAESAVESRESRVDG